MISAHHNKYFAQELTRRCPPDSFAKLAGALVDAQVDLNQHKVYAALDLAQKWAERKRRILVISPSNLRKQWFQ